MLHLSATEYNQGPVRHGDNFWLIEPETRTGRYCKENAWIETRRFVVENTEIYLDLDWLFVQLDDLDD